MKWIDMKEAKDGDWYFICQGDGVMRYVQCRIYDHYDEYGSVVTSTKEFYRPDGLLETIDHAVDYIFEV